MNESDLVSKKAPTRCVVVIIEDFSLVDRICLNVKCFGCGALKFSVNDELCLEDELQKFSSKNYSLSDISCISKLQSDFMVFHCSSASQLTPFLRHLEMLDTDCILCIVGKINTVAARAPTTELNSLQSWQLVDGLIVFPSLKLEGIFLTCHPYAVRNDTCSEFSVNEVHLNGCNGTINARHLIRELAYKIQKLSKYGA